MASSLDRKLRKSLDKRWSMRFRIIEFESDGLDGGDDLDGVVIHLNDDLVVLRIRRGLEFDGVVVIPRLLVRDWRDGSFEKAQNEILRYTGQISRARAPAWMVRCGSVADVVGALMRRRIWPYITMSVRNPKRTSHYLGPILERDGESFSLRCYGSCGVWQKPCRLRFNRVLRIRYDDAYSRNFNRYMKARRPPPTT